MEGCSQAVYTNCYTEFCHLDYLQLCGPINSHIVLFVKHHTSALHVKTSKREKSHLKTCLSLGTQVLSTLPACTHPKYTIPAYLYALYAKAWVRTLVKVKRREFHL